MMTIEDFGARVASVWQGLRPSTRSLVERALSTPAPLQQGPAATTATASRRESIYDARSEWELSRLLAALDERAAEVGADTLSAEQSRDLLRMTETCAAVLNREARSSEVFAQLLERALRVKDYARVDEIADVMRRASPRASCARRRVTSTRPSAPSRRRLCCNCRPASPPRCSATPWTPRPRASARSQADEYQSEEARIVVTALQQVEDAEDDF